jgi:hypothetical protein
MSAPEVDAPLGLGRTTGADPLLPVVNDGFEATKIANFPKNEHWRGRPTADSIAYETYLRVQKLVRFRLIMGMFLPGR